MKPKQVIEQLQSIKHEIEDMLKKFPKVFDDVFSEKDIQALDHAINCVGAIEQIKWERDIAIQQLNELGYQFGEKIWREFNLDNEELQDHHFYLVAHKDYGTPMKAKWHQDCPPTFQVYIGDGKCDEYIDELSNYHAEENKKITHWCKLPNLPKGSDKE